MPFSLFYNSSRFSITYPNIALLRKKWAVGYIQLFILFCLSFNTALAGQIYSTDFETGSISAGQVLDNGFYWAVGKNTTVSSENSKTGSYSLKFTFPGVPDGKDSFSEQKFILGGYYPDLWIKYDLYIPGNYYHRDSTGSDNNKGFFHVWAGDYSSATREGPMLGPSFWPNSGGTSSSAVFTSARINGVTNISNHWYQSIGNPYYDPGNRSQAITNSDKGQWMTIVIHVKYASIANNDGVAEVWKTNWQGNTVKLHDIHNGSWYGTKVNSTQPARGFDKGYLLGWANSGFDEETILYIDNLTFSTTPLSNDYVPDTTAAPKPPTIY